MLTLSGSSTALFYCLQTGITTKQNHSQGTWCGTFPYQVPFSFGGTMKKISTRKLTCNITDIEKEESRKITQLKNLAKSDSLDSGEVGELGKMISKKKTILVEKIYRTAHPRAKEELFYKLSDGRWKSNNPTFVANSREELVEKLYQKRKDKGLSYEDCEKLIQDPYYFATMLVECGYADAIVAGAEGTTKEVLKPALQIIKTKKK